MNLDQALIRNIQNIEFAAADPAADAAAPAKAGAYIAAAEMHINMPAAMAA